jgi:UDP-N-acetylmuramate dehydrogenase
VLNVALRGTDVLPYGEDTLFAVNAGEPWDRFVSMTVSRGLAGLECLSGIPGTVGGTPIQNVGAYGQEVSGAIETVHALDRSTGTMTTLVRDQCGFDYRTSRFKREDAGRFIICAVTFRLRPGAATVSYPDVITHFESRGIAAPDVTDVREAVLGIRRAKGMVIDWSDADTCSIGSFFMNPVVPVQVHARIAAAESGPVPAFVMPTGDLKIPAAWLIERSGFSKGYTHGPVGVSSKHPLAIINRGGATARDVLDLAVRIKRRVVERFDIWLRPEPVFVGFTDDSNVTYLQQVAR